MHIDDIKIDPELESLLPALSEEKQKSLRDAMIREGFVDGELTVWKGHDILLDGHNRLREYKAASASNMVDPPRIREREFATRKDAMEWMIAYQDGRRNWTKAERKAALGMIYNEAKKPSGRPVQIAETPEIPAPNNVATTCHIISEPQPTAARIATEQGVSERTVRTAGKFADAVEKIRQVNPKAAADIKAETLQVTQADVIAIANSGDIAKALKNHKIHGDWRGKKPDAPAPAKPKKPGKPTFDDKSIDKELGALARLFDDRSKVHGKGSQHSACIDAMDGVAKAWKTWREGKA
jgi:hypothetical protein